MSQLVRQSSRFAASDWTTIYTAFLDINFAAYDQASIKSSLIDYLSLNFPEQFTDFTDNSEVSIIITMLANMAERLAFRMDLNSRENFLDVATRRESVLRLARFLSYVPQRNLPSRGLLQITSVATNQSLTDSDGNFLNNTQIFWNDPDNVDWQDQFTIILNAALDIRSPIGIPVTTATLNGINTELYQLNTIPTTNGVYDFTASAQSVTLNIELTNAAIDPVNGYTENSPNPLNRQNIYYQNDGNGNSSPNTGYFFYFKEGTLRQQTLNYTSSIENRVQAITTNNINQLDVWVQSLDNNQNVTSFWTPVSALNGNNAIYNSIDKSIRDIFEIITQDNDQVAIRFADGRFGNIPMGNVRYWYRASAGQSYTIQPTDIQDQKIQIQYFGTDTRMYTLTVTVSLTQSVTNSNARQSNASIQQLAPLIYPTGDRMVTGQDYNVFPLQQGNIAKLSVINRTFSGQSLYEDPIDPTGTYSNTKIFSDDGRLYEEEDDFLTIIGLTAGTTSDSILLNNIEPVLTDSRLINFFTETIPESYAALSGNNPLISPLQTGSTYQYILWQQANNQTFSSTGRFLTYPSSQPAGTLVLPLGAAPANGASPQPVGSTADSVNTPQFIQIGALLKFNTAGWVSVVNIVDDGTTLFTTGQGGVTLSQDVLTNDYIVQIIPAFRTTFTGDEIANIEAQITSNNTFGIRYDIPTATFVVITGKNLALPNVPFSLEFQGDTTGFNKDSSWIIRLDNQTSRYQITTRGIRYIFESLADVRFFTYNFLSAVDPSTGKVVTDNVEILSINAQPATANALGETFTWDMSNAFFYADGSAEPRRVQVTFTTQNDIPLNPDQFDLIVTNGLDPNDPRDALKLRIFWQLITDPNTSYQNQIPTTTVSMVLTALTTNLTGLALVSGNYQISQESAFIFNSITLQTGDQIVLTAQTTIAQNGVYQIGFDGVDNVWVLYKIVSGIQTTVFAVDTNTFYLLNTVTNIYGPNDGTWFWALGRGNLKYQYNHFSDLDEYIDPYKTNIMDALVLTTDYDTAFRAYIASPSTAPMPTPPTIDELNLNFETFNDNKMISDELVYHPASYKIIYGAIAQEELQARLAVVTVPGTSMSDGQIKAGIISAIADWFAISNWDFGETFYFQDMGAYIIQTLATAVASIVPVPSAADARFGDLFEVQVESDRIAICGLAVTDIDIVTTNSASILRIGS